MKKSKKFLLSVASGALATVMVMGNSGVVALAESATPENVVDSYSQVKGINFSTVEFGDAIEVPANAGYTVSVVKPDGSSVNGEVGLGLSVTTNMVGHYTVIVSNADSIKYTYDVLCTSSRDYKLEIADYDIPSFLKVKENGEDAIAVSSLPKAKVYYEEDGEKVYVQNAGSDLEITPTISGVSDENDIAKESATAYLSYVYDVGTGVYVDKQYKIIIQKGFNDQVKPTLSVASYSESASLNIKYTLPIATATDAYDARVKVVISVKDPDGEEVAKAIVNEKTGYATGVESAKVEFDNLDNMSFYPTKLGDYVVTYTAIDDNENTSNALSYVLTVKDQKGPTINVDRASIPEKWAYSKVYYEEDENEVAKDDLNIYLPIPEYYDNSANALTVSLTVKDPEGKEVAKVTKIENLKAETPTAVVITDGAMGSFVKATEKAGMAVEFDVKGYVAKALEKIADDTIKSDYKYAGVYTVQYSVQDTVTKSTTSSSTYSINVSETYNDDAKVGITPSAEIAKNVILAEGDSFTLPTFTISSSSDGHLDKSYIVKTSANSMDYVKFAGGEELTLIKSEGNYYLSYEIDGVEYKLAVASGDSITYDISATADSGRYASYSEKSTELVIPEAEDKTYAVQANADLSEITIALGGVDNRFVGVEMGVKSEDGEYVSFDATVFYNKYLDKKVIKDIKFVNPNEDGTYYLEVKVYDIYGTSQVNVYKFDLSALETDDNRESEESAFSTSTSVGKAITWKYTKIQTGSVFGSDVETIATAHKVSGGKFAWMGNEFTPLQENTYTLIDTVVPLDNAGAIVTSYDSIIKDKFEMRSSVVASESLSKVVVLDNAMPSYLANADASVAQIPSAVIYDAKKNYAYEIKVTNPNGNVSTYKNYEKFQNEFKFTSDGTYTVAYVVNGASVKSYSIKVGDVTPVAFSVNNFADSSDVVITKSAGYEFNFEEIVLKDQADIDNESKLTFIKSIRNAKGELVGKEYEKSGSSGRKEKGSTVTLSDTGEYTVTYTVRDQSGNESHRKIIIKIVSKTEAEDFDYTTLSTIIILVVVLGIVGIIAYYIIDSRKKNKKKNK